VPGKVRVDLQTCRAIQPAFISSISISGKTLTVASYIDENTTPMRNAPKVLSTGIREGIYTSMTGQQYEGMSDMTTCEVLRYLWGETCWCVVMLLWTGSNDLMTAYIGSTEGVLLLIPR
jgi:hypothetical protein